VRLAARLHHSLPSGQLKTIRYEHLMEEPGDVLAELGRFAGTTVATAGVRALARDYRRSRRPSAYERSLRAEEIAEIEKIAGEELRRLGYLP
jgi:hypothetical protein